jgi:TPR repeat protein
LKRPPQLATWAPWCRPPQSTVCHPPALLQFNVGVYFLSTRGPAQSDSTAVEWFTKAANLGNPEAAVNLAMCYMAGRGVVKARPAPP